MRFCAILISLLFSSSIFAQLTMREQFEKINTVADAQKFIAANPSVKPEMMNLTYGKDTAHVEQRLLKLNKGEIMTA